MSDGTKILLVEDESTDRVQIFRLLSKNNYSARIHSETTLSGAQRCLKNDKFDVILLDLGLPDSTGIGTLAEMKVTAPETPLVVVTGQRDESLAPKVVAMGAQDLLSKDGLGPELLTRSLRCAIDRQREKVRLWQEVELLHQSVSEVRREAATDTLTRIPNRRGLQEHLARLNSMDDRPYLVAGLIDLDNFKEINDTYDHATGDAVLRAVAAKIFSHLRGDDFAARVGGDEFVVLFRNLGQDACDQAARRIVEEISKEPVVFGGNVVPVSATMGLSPISDGTLDMESILRSTHRALETGKSSGKGRALSTWALDAGQKGGRSGRRAKDLNLAVGSAGMLALKTGKEAGRWFRFFNRLDDGSFQPLYAVNLDLRLLRQTALRGADLVNSWLEKHPDQVVHIDLDSGLLVDSYFPGRFAARFPDLSLRRRLVPFFNLRGAGCTDLRLVRNIRALSSAGFAVGMRGLGDGNVPLGAVAGLRPAWIRLSPGFVASLGQVRQQENLAFLMGILRKAEVSVSAPAVGGNTRKLLAKLGVAMAALQEPSYEIAVEVVDPRRGRAAKPLSAGLLP